MLQCICYKVIDTHMINTETGLCIECDGTGITASPAYQSGGEIVDAIEYPCECTLKGHAHLSANDEDYDDQLI